MFDGMIGKAGDRVITGIKDAQGAALSAVSMASDFVGGFIPSLPALPVQMPEPQMFVERTFGFAERVLGSQKEYALGLVDALAPITAKLAPNGSPVAKAAKANGKAGA